MGKNDKNTKNNGSSKSNITSISSKLKIHMTDQPTMTENDWSFGGVIKEYRNKAGLSQNSLAEMMNTSRNTIINWETDKSRPDIDNIRELCLLLGIPLFELFNIPSTEQPSTKEKTMLSQFRKLSAVSQRIITRMVNSMYEEETDARDEYLRSSYRILPLEATAVAAGTGCDFNDLPAEPIFIKNNPYSELADAIIRVSGASMEPLYHDGDFLYVVYTQEHTDGDDVICTTADGAVVKRAIDDKLISLNTKYPFGEKHEDDHVRILGRVIGIVSQNDIAVGEDQSNLEILQSKELREFYKLHNK